MGRIPEDPGDRREWLRAWATAQEQRAHEAQPGARRVRRALRRWLYQVLVRLNRAAYRMLDRGLDTAAHARSGEHDHADRVYYVPTPWHVLPRALVAVRARRSDVLVDFGCGKGRILHQAARWPLRRVIGVEISPRLAEQASATLARHRDRYRCRDVEVVVADAASYRVPDDMTIGFFFDPFRGESMVAAMQRVVESLDRRPRRVRLIYVHPRDAGLVLATGRFRLVRELRGGLRDVRVGRAAIFESV
jgi:SAM-dependent methyltransferase